MGKEKKSGQGTTHGARPGVHAKERFRKNARDLDWTVPAPPGLQARPEVPNVRSKHQSYYEIVENKDKKKKLEYQVGSRTPQALISRIEAHSVLSPAAGNSRQGTAARLRVRSYWEPRVDHGLQRAVAGTRCLDIHRHGQPGRCLVSRGNADETVDRPYHEQ